ncbi:hypothetical protein GCM10010505_35820 [Kitasatospora aburaviensis]
MNASDDHTEPASDEAVLRRLSDVIGPCPERVTESAKALFQRFGTRGDPAFSPEGPGPGFPPHVEGLSLNMTQQIP